MKQDPTLPFSADEVNAVVLACGRFPIKGVHSEGNRKRLRAIERSPTRTHHGLKAYSKVADIEPTTPGRLTTVPRIC